MNSVPPLEPYANPFTHLRSPEEYLEVGKQVDPSLARDSPMLKILRIQAIERKSWESAKALPGYSLDAKLFGFVLRLMLW